MKSFKAICLINDESLRDHQTNLSFRSKFNVIALCKSNPNPCMIVNEHLFTGSFFQLYTQSQHEVELELFHIYKIRNMIHDC